MNLFAIIINSEMYYFIDGISTEKNSIIDKYISTYRISFNMSNDETFKKLLEDINRDLNITLNPIKLKDIYRPLSE